MATTPACTWCAGDVADLDQLVERDAGQRHRHPSGVQSRHRPSRDRAVHRLRRRDGPHPSRRRGDAPVGCTRILYASGSGVYGDLGEVEADEDHGPLLPISTYGASKLAGEALISSYCQHVRPDRLRVPFRQRGRPPADARRGVRLRAPPAEGPEPPPDPRRRRQSKSYVHVTDVIEAVLLAARSAVDPLSVYNVATGRLHHGARDRRDGRRPRSDWTRPGRSSSSPGATAGGKATSLS